MALQHDGPAPYAPPATIIEFLGAYRGRSIPTPITGAVLERVGVTASLIPRVTQTLRLLDLLTDDGQPTTELEELRKAPEAELRDRFAALLRVVYADVFQYIDPATDPVEKVTDQFRHYEPRGQLKRMVTLFLTLCEFAGILPEGSVPRRRVTTPTATPSSQPRKQTKTPAKAATPAKQEPSVQKQSPTTLTPMTQSAPHPLLAGMLSALPPIPADWPQSKSTLGKSAREAWLKAVAANLDVLYDLGGGGNSSPEAGTEDDRE
jgi:uncharacterized protein DUF5343